MSIKAPITHVSKRSCLGAGGKARAGTPCLVHLSAFYQSELPLRRAPQHQEAQEPLQDWQIGAAAPQKDLLTLRPREGRRSYWQGFCCRSSSPDKQLRPGLFSKMSINYSGVFGAEVLVRFRTN